MMSIYFYKICKKVVEVVNGDGVDYLKIFFGKWYVLLLMGFIVWFFFLWKEVGLF